MPKGALLDLDGTVYYGKHEVPGARRFINFMEEQGIAYLFVTNRANRTPQEICEHLRAYEIVCDPDHILTSAHATAAYIEKGSAFCVGEEGLCEALNAAGITITEDAPDYVVVSFDRRFTYDKLKKACRLIDNGATFIATNPDKGLRTENGITPGTGAIVAAVEAGCGRDPIVIGKPQKYLFEMALKRLGLGREDVIAVGDNVETDVVAGSRAGIRTALILSGISTREDVEASPVKPTWVVRNYDELAEIVAHEA